VLVQAARVDEDLDPALVPTPGVHLGDPGDRAELGLEDPVLRRAELRSGSALTAHHIVEHLAEAGGDWTDLRPLHACGQLDRAEALGHHLARSPDVGAVLEHQRHLG
jgi:hypothetical protein